MWVNERGWLWNVGLNVKRYDSYIWKEVVEQADCLNRSETSKTDLLGLCLTRLKHFCKCSTHDCSSPDLKWVAAPFCQNVIHAGEKAWTSDTSLVLLPNREMRIRQSFKELECTLRLNNVNGIVFNGVKLPPVKVCEETHILICSLIICRGGSSLKIMYCNIF